MVKAICINRRYGTGGVVVAEKLAEKLGYTYLGDNLLEKAIEYGGLEASKHIKEYLKTDEKAPNKMLYRLLDEGNEHVEKQSPAADIIYDLERQIITEEAKKGGVVVLGHCGAEILKKEGIDCISVFVTASAEYRAAFIDDNSEKDISRKEAEKQVEHVDDQRKAYFHNYTKKVWDDPSTYDVVINVENLGLERTIELLSRIGE